MNTVITREKRERAEMVAPHKYYLLLPPHWQEDKLKMGIKIYIISARK